MEATLLIIHVLLAVFLIGLVLIQHGKGADVGASFGAGASSTVFGSKGTASFLTKLTTFIAISFFATSLYLAYFAVNNSKEASLIDMVKIKDNSRIVDEAPNEKTLVDGVKSSINKNLPSDIPNIANKPAAKEN